MSILDLNRIAEVDDWLDAGVSGQYVTQPLAQDWARVSKVSEELGEAIQALIGCTGQNPRKGFTHRMDEVIDELADVALTAIFAIQHFTKNDIATTSIMQRKLNRVADRAQVSREN